MEEPAAAALLPEPAPVRADEPEMVSIVVTSDGNLPPPNYPGLLRLSLPSQTPARPALIEGGSVATFVAGGAGAVSIGSACCDLGSGSDTKATGGLVYAGGTLTGNEWMPACQGLHYTVAEGRSCPFRHDFFEGRVATAVEQVRAEAAWACAALEERLAAAEARCRELAGRLAASEAAAAESDIAAAEERAASEARYLVLERRIAAESARLSHECALGIARERTD